MADLFITGCQSGDDVAASEITLWLHWYSQHGAASSLLPAMLQGVGTNVPGASVYEVATGGELGTAHTAGS